MTVAAIPTFWDSWAQHGILGLIIATLFLSQYLVFRYFIMKIMDQTRDERMQNISVHVEERKEWRVFIDKITTESMRLQQDSNHAVLALTTAVEKMNNRVRSSDFENNALRSQLANYQHDR